MSDLKFKVKETPQHYINILIENAYNDLKNREIRGEWKRITAFATITTNTDGPISIQCNRITQEWPEPAFFGLIAHELSHITVGNSTNSEKLSDIDVIERGLGVYLAIERIIADKYTDYVVRRGSDRYLGYDSIRNRLSSHEIQQLDRLMIDLGMTTEF